MSETTTDQRSFLDRQRDAALEEIREQETRRREVERTILGENRDRSRLTELVKLGGDYLAQITKRDGTAQWTFVVNGKASNWYHQKQEDAILHLIATRYDNNPNSNGAAAFYAGRVLGQPADA